MNKPNDPNEIWLGKSEYSMWTDWRVNGWLFAATILSSFFDIVFQHRVRQWDVAFRALVAVLPFIAVFLWMRALSRWIRGMDELHRRIVMEAVLFATSATFFFVMLWHRLDSAGVFETIFGRGRNAEASWDILTIAHVFLLMTLFYSLGYRISSRRYE